MTLEKVLLLIAQRGSFKLQYYRGVPSMNIDPCWVVHFVEDETGNDEWPPRRGQPTPEDAAGAALLGTL